MSAAASQPDDSGGSVASGPVERFRPTSGRPTGLVILVAAGLTVGLAVLDPGTVRPEVTAGAVLAAVVGWVVTLRPRVSLVGDDLVLRGMVDEVAIPLAAVEELAVRQVLAVRAGDRRYTSPALGRSRSSLLRRKKAEAPHQGADRPAAAQAESYAAFVEERLRQRIDDARAVAGVRPGSPEQVALGSGVRRRAAWPEIAAPVASALALVVAIVW